MRPCGEKMVSCYEEDTFEALATAGAKALKWPEMLIRKIEKPAGPREKGQGMKCRVEGRTKPSS